MEIPLTDNEVRVLGCLMEKEMATPDYYPLSLNALTHACNQKSNRHPVVSLDEETVVDALNGLRERKLIRQSNTSRVPKYEQIFSKDLKLVTREEAIVCTLLVRGPQTIGQIRSRTERLYAFSTLDEVKETLASLADMELVHCLPRQPGRIESRYTHRLGADPQETIDKSALRPEPDNPTGNKQDDRIRELEEQIDGLRGEIRMLRQEFTAFKSQFE